MEVERKGKAQFFCLMLLEILPELGRTHTIGAPDRTGKVMGFTETTLAADRGNGQISAQQKLSAPFHNMFH